MLSYNLERETVLAQRLSLLLLGLLLMAFSPAAQAQSVRAGDTFYGKIGVGASDYTGDFPAQNVGHPFDLQEFTRGSGLPVVVSGEVGYRFSHKWSLGLGFQAGNYPIVGYGGQGDGISDSYRYTPQLLGRYTFGHSNQTVAPYIDGGVNATFGGATDMGVGPSIGGGVNILLNRSLSFYVESRFNLSLPDDAIDGVSAESNDGITGPFDSANQLLGFGLKVDFSTPAPPKVIALDGPAKVRTGESATFTATINGGEAARPLSSQWDFGNGATKTGLTATYTFDRPGTHEVAFSASNEGGEAKKSITVKATPPPRPSTSSTKIRIASLTATPDPVEAGRPVQFSSAVEGSSAPTYTWSFGDGGSATGSAPTHTYENPGQYTARLSVSNDAGEDARTVTVRVKQRTSQKQATPWRIVVASMRDDDGAEAMAQRYRDRLAGSLSVDIVAANTDQGLRYRVVVGAFEDDRTAQQAIEEHAADLPPEAWTLRLR